MTAIINNGFKFTNLTGDCYIENNTLICNDTHFVRVYDFALKSRVLLDALAVDASKDEQLLRFTQQYGSLLKWSYSVVSDEDEAIELDNESEFELKYRNRFSLDIIRELFERLQRLIKLMTSYKLSNYPDMLCNCLYLLLSSPYLGVDDHNENATSVFSDDFEHVASRMDNIPLLESVKHYIGLSRIALKKWDLQVPFFIDLLSNTCTLCEKNSITLEDIICKEPSVDLELLMKGMDQSILKTCSEIVISDTINYVINDIKPCFHVLPNGDFQGDWIIPDLHSALYLDVFLRNANSILLKKCENPTCDEYFEATFENKTKKYCSQRCANLMAKRMQREREKSK